MTAANQHEGIEVFEAILYGQHCLDKSLKKHMNENLHNQ